MHTGMTLNEILLLVRRMHGDGKGEANHQKIVKLMNRLESPEVKNKWGAYEQRMHRLGVEFKSLLEKIEAEEGGEEGLEGDEAEGEGKEGSSGGDGKQKKVNSGDVEKGIKEKGRQKSVPDIKMPDADDEE